MSKVKNEIMIRGYVNYIKRKDFGSGDFALSASVSLAAGKVSKDSPDFRKEYFSVQLSSEVSKRVEQTFVDGCFVQVEGRLRNVSYDKNGAKQYFAYVEGFDCFVLEPPMQANQNPSQPLHVAQQQLQQPAYQPQQQQPTPNQQAQQTQYQPQPQQQYQPQQPVDLNNIPF